MSMRMRGYNAVLPRLARWDSRRSSDVTRMREQGERFERRMPLSAGVAVTETSLGGRPALQFDEALGGRDDASGVVLFLHGGGYRQGSPVAGRGASFLCLQGGPRILSPTYRLAPEHPAPAALDDAWDAYCALIEHVEPERVVVMGESAGGGLAVALLQRAAREGRPLPAGMVAMFPWVDLTLSGRSVEQNARRDLLTLETLSESADQYAGALALDDPLVSPLFGSFERFPPTAVHVGTRDLLLDDARRIAATMQEAGAPVVLREWPECCHGFQNLPSPEAKACKREVREFVLRVLSCPGAAADAPAQPGR